MNLQLTELERTLLRACLLDTVVNSSNFSTIEKEYLDDIYHRIHEYEENLHSKKD